MRQELLRVELGELYTLDPRIFPEANDFVVDLGVMDSATSLRYLAPSLGIIVTFPWWDKAVDEVRGWTPAEIPCGSISSPYWDRDQGWNLLIWQVGDQVLIAEGDRRADSEEEWEVYDRWFSVSRSLYRAEWARAIETLQPR